MIRLPGFVADLRPGERRLVLLMTGNIFLLLIFTYLLKPARDAFFLVSATPEQLPFVYLLTALAAAPVTAAYARAGLRRELGRLIRQTSLVLLASLLGLYVLVGGGRVWTAYLFYAWVGVATGLTTSQFWLLANTVFDAAQAKRIFPLLSVGAIVGAVVGGEATGALVAAGLPAAGLLLVAAGVLALNAAGGVVIWRRWGGHERPATFREDAAKGTGLGIVRSVLRSRHLSLTVGIITLTVMTASFGDFIFKSASWAAYPGQGDLTAFLGRFYGRMSLVSLGVQLVLANRLIRRLGAGGVLFVLPGVLTLGAVGMVLSPGLFAAMALKGGDLGLRHSLDRTSRELLFLPIPLALKKRTKAFMDVFVDRWARGLAGVLLLVCTVLLGLDLRGIALVMLGLLAVWLVLAVFMRGAYLDSFRRAVVRRDIDLGELRLRLDDDQAVGLLVEALGSDNRREVLYALGMLEGVRTDQLASALRPLLDHDSPEIRSRALVQLAAAAGEEDARAAARALNDAELEVRVAAVRFLAAVALTAADRRQLLADLLAAPAPRRNAALAWLTAHPDDGATADLVTGEVTEAVLACTGENGCEGRRQLGALARLPEGCTTDLWDRLLADDDPRVVEAAMAGVGRRRELERTDWLLDMLADAALRVPARRTLAVLGRADNGVLARIETFFADPAAPVRSREIVPRVLAEVPLRRSVVFLQKHLATGEPQFRFAVLKALGRLRANHPRLAFDRGLVAGQVRIEAGRFVQLARLEGLLPDTGPGAELLRRTLGETQQLRLESVFRLLALIYPAHDILRAYHGVVSGRRLARATAQEFLDNLLAVEHRRLVLGLLDDGTATAAWTGAGIEVETPARTTAEALDHLATDCDPWLAACAIFAGAEAANPAADVHLTRVGEDMLTPIEKVLLLQKVDLFSEVPTDQLAALAAIARDVSVLDGDTIFRTDDQADALYLVLDGGVRLHRGERTITTAGRGDTFGTWALFDDEPRVMDATAEADTRLLRIDATEFADLLSDDVRMAQGVIRTVTRRLRQLAGRAS